MGGFGGAIQCGGLPLRRTADQVTSLVRADWRVIATALGRTPDVGDAFGSLYPFGLVRIVELRSLPMEARRVLLRAKLNTADPSAVDLINRCGPVDGRALRVLATRVRARAALRTGKVDVDVAAATLRAGLRLGRNKHGPPRSPTQPRPCAAALAESSTSSRLVSYRVVASPGCSRPGRGTVEHREGSSTGGCRRQD